jgi:hypothetical protein
MQTGWVIEMSTKAKIWLAFLGLTALEILILTAHVAFKMSIGRAFALVVFLIVMMFSNAIINGLLED